MIKILAALVISALFSYLGYAHHLLMQGVNPLPLSLGLLARLLQRISLNTLLGVYVLSLFALFYRNLFSGKKSDRLTEDILDNDQFDRIN